jgi:hypothetical protein
MQKLPRRFPAPANFSRAHFTRSSQGHALPLGEIMLRDRRRGMPYAQCAQRARDLGFEEADIQVWIVGCRMLMARRRGRHP